ncbi:MAG: hypothetical protein JO085_12075, partial [Acidimicrobiia bacterium]|nr:hypothetical protein [Acidimicrobiia bacterium]
MKTIAVAATRAGEFDVDRLGEGGLHGEAWGSLGQVEGGGVRRCRAEGAQLP